MNLDDNQFNLENYILNNIKLIYETLSINKSIFIIQSFLFDNIFQKLKEDDYPVCSYENFTKFENHNSRILMIKDIDFNKIYMNFCTTHFKDNVNLILFINTPKFIDNNIFKRLLLTNNLENINIFEI
tara:strand:+ start:2921 stop:3304 length:384 start_codon:yes stop_codon:yes gene_type:complete